MGFVKKVFGGGSSSSSATPLTGKVSTTSSTSSTTKTPVAQPVIPAASTPTVVAPQAPVVNTPTGASVNVNPARMKVDYIPDAMNQTNQQDITTQWNEVSLGDVGNTSGDTTLSTRKKQRGSVSNVLGF